MHASSALALCEHLEPVVAIAWKVVQINHLQEQFTHQIADEIQRVTGTNDVLVVGPVSLHLDARD